MPVVREKRMGLDRRSGVAQAKSVFGERRSEERRQVVIAEIPFDEWAMHFASFRRQMDVISIRQSAGAPGVANDDSGQA